MSSDDAADWREEESGSEEDSPEDSSAEEEDSSADVCGRAQDVSASAFGGICGARSVDMISDGLCQFSHTKALKLRTCFFRNIVHHEVTCSPHIDVKMLLETLTSHEIAAKKTVKFLVMHHDNELLTTMVPPPPVGWQPRDDRDESAIGDDPELRHRHRKLLELNALFSKHEGEQRLWAYLMHYEKIDAPLDLAFEADIVQRFPQLQRGGAGSKAPELQRVFGHGAEDSDVFARVESRKTFFMTRLAFGSHREASHLQGFALTLSLPEIFRAYWDIHTADTLYQAWLEKPIIVNVRQRSMRVASTPASSSAVGGQPLKKRRQGPAHRR